MEEKDTIMQNQLMFSSKRLKKFLILYCNPRTGKSYWEILEFFSLVVFLGTIFFLVLPFLAGMVFQIHSVGKLSENYIMAYNGMFAIHYLIVMFITAPLFFLSHGFFIIGRGYSKGYTYNNANNAWEAWKKE